MSTFRGRLNEENFKSFCIDCFSEENYDCKAFFLSHFHSDHMRGIREPSFHALFEKKGIFFYCSLITKNIILNNDEINIPKYRIIVLDKDGTNVDAGNGKYVKVTYLPAGHCPGSIMFLFEGFDLRILYTGDFRLSMKDLKNMRSLHVVGGQVLPVDSLYFDSTFATEVYESFPTRHESFIMIKELIENWFAQHELNKIVIQQSASIGIEFLMNGFNENLNGIKVHVSERSMQCFLSPMNRFEFLTTDPGEAKIHFCEVPRCYESKDCFKKNYPGKYLLTIKPSALIFTTEIQIQKGLKFYDGNLNIVRVAYSSHSSFKELREFISYFSPTTLHPCVIPRGSSEQELLDYISGFLKKEICDNVKRKNSVSEEGVSDILKRVCQRTPFKEDEKIKETCIEKGLDSPPL